MHNFYTKFNKWAAIGRKEEKELVWPLTFNFPAGVYMYGEMAGVLRKPKSSSRHSVGVGQERKEGKGVKYS